MASRILRLPNEILGFIAASLPNRDIKNLRLSCAHLRNISRLRFDRVFISANPRNLEVFGAIAAHEELRNQVVEIVWDDARLTLSAAGYSEDNDDADIYWEDSYPEANGNTEEHGGNSKDTRGCPAWFVKAFRENIVPETSHDRKRHEEKLASQMLIRMSMRDSYAYFMGLYRQQQAIIETGEDIEMFRRGLKAFPSLRRITITPIAYKQFLCPWYSTPMIRSFPAGFNYPIPEGWPTHKIHPEMIGFWNNVEVKDTWRGFCIVTRELARLSEKHHITEFVVDVNRCLTGLNQYIFFETSPEYEDLKTLFSTKGFRRIDLAVHAGRRQQRGWDRFDGELLRKALATANDLEHFYFHTNTTRDSVWTVLPNYFPLLDSFPIAQWPRLKHFGLSRVIIDMPGLFKFFTLMPPSIQTIELSTIFFQRGSYEELLTRIREGLDWQSRSSPPKLTISIPSRFHINGLSIWISDEVDSFLYHGGPNPFENGSDREVAGDIGTLRHDFDARYDLSNYSLR
jgi:hypothetical protein